MKKILITGGCGFIGSNLSIYLKNHGFNIEILDNLSRQGSSVNFGRLKKFKIKIYKIDILEKNKILKLPKYDFIIDCSALVEANVKKENIDNVLNVNFMGTNNIMTKCINDNSKIIFMSTSRVYSINKIYELFKNQKNFNKKIVIRKKYLINESFSTDSPNSFYGLSKKCSEQLILEYNRLYNTHYIINRFGVVAGPWQFGKVEQGFLSLWIWKHLVQKKLSYVGYGGNGFQVRDILHVDDLCEIIVKQLQNFNSINNKTFNVGGGINNAINLNEVTKIAENLTGNKIKIGKKNKTNLSDIPFFISNNKSITKHYKWKPKKNLIEISQDIYNWQIKNFSLLKKFMNK